MAAKTKAQLEEQVLSLKEKLKDLSKEFKDSLKAKSGDLGERPYRAIGLFLDDTTYKFARFDYNPDTKAVEFISVEQAARVPEAAHMAKFNMEEAIQKEIFARLEEHYV